MAGMRPRRGRLVLARGQGEGSRSGSVKIVKMEVGRDGDGEMVRFLYTTLAKQHRPEASPPCLKWWR